MIVVVVVVMVYDGIELQRSFAVWQAVARMVPRVCWRCAKELTKSSGLCYFVVLLHESIDGLVRLFGVIE